MDDARRTALSKFLSFVLRHNPQAIGIQLNANGWIGVEELLDACAKSGRGLTRQELEEVVATSNKQRFAFNSERTQIRANQGHSLEIELNHEVRVPPALLFHGTTQQSLKSIRERGLLKMQRHHVHLSPDVETATNVGQRRGRVVVLSIQALRMHGDGFVFFLSPNDVWLTDRVPSEYIVFPD
jgi:putative RNA 2'-phosphotransferase